MVPKGSRIPALSGAITAGVLAIAALAAMFIASALARRREYETAGSIPNPKALARAIIRLSRRNRVEKLRFAAPAELGDFVPQISQCHDNASRFCEANPGYTVVGGWIVQSVGASGSSALLIRHSVVSDQAGNLTCVTLAASGQHETAGPFVRHDPKWGGFDSFGPTVSFVEGIGVLES
ncbi:hypothetical protein V5F40_09110 [Xanthobacter sp. DSM 14520]|uniref:hypothetical protein n=1 Tax=Xanthobacter autotrophicus (strain ATCC BAA-1158 / Py2) TaxID=78245 RepID=UPI00372C432F